MTTDIKISRELALFESIIGKKPDAFMHEPVYQVTESEVLEFARQLANHAEEPLAWVYEDNGSLKIDWLTRDSSPGGRLKVGMQLYTSPPAPVAVVLPDRWQDLYEKDCDSNENGLATFSSNSYMQDEIDLLRACLDKVKEMSR